MVCLVDHGQLVAAGLAERLERHAPADHARAVRRVESAAEDVQPTQRAPAAGGAE